MFAREGYPFILGAAALAAIAFAVALRLRSWPLWLGALVLTVAALSVAWFFRNPARVGDRATNVAIATVGTRVTAHSRFAVIRPDDMTSDRFANVANTAAIANLLAP